jgi:hypothetical protein
VSHVLGRDSDATILDGNGDMTVPVAVRSNRDAGVAMGRCVGVRFGSRVSSLDGVARIRQDVDQRRSQPLGVRDDLGKSRLMLASAKSN